MMHGNANANARCERKERTYSFLPISAVEHPKVHDKSSFTPQVSSFHSGFLKSLMFIEIHIFKLRYNGKDPKTFISRMKCLMKRIKKSRSILRCQDFETQNT